MSETAIRESCSWECNPEAVKPICAVCRDIRMVATQISARRYIGGSSVSEVFPCPACARQLLDGDGKKYGIPGRRYGNPMIQNDDDYYKWKARNAHKGFGWQELKLFESEERQAKHLRQTYPAADPRWIRIWVLGERRVQEEPSFKP